MDDGGGQELVNAVVGRVDDTCRQVAPDLTLEPGTVQSFKVVIDVRTDTGIHPTDGNSDAGGDGKADHRQRIRGDSVTAGTGFSRGFEGGVSDFGNSLWSAPFEHRPMASVWRMAAGGRNQGAFRPDLRNVKNPDFGPSVISSAPAPGPFGGASARGRRLPV
jgi:hypothetical protein